MRNHFSWIPTTYGETSPPKAAETEEHIYPQVVPRELEENVYPEVTSVDPEAIPNPDSPISFYKPEFVLENDENDELRTVLGSYWTLYRIVSILCFSLIFAAAVGGIVAGVFLAKANSSSSTDNSPTIVPPISTSATISATISATTSAAVGTAIPSSPSNSTVGSSTLGFAAATCGTPNYIFVYYQGLGSEIYMISYSNSNSNSSGWNYHGKMNLSTTVIHNTPLSAVCWVNGTQLHLRNYFLDSQSKLNEMTGTCNTDGMNCIWTDQSLGLPLTSGGGLAAAYLSGMGIRVYCLDIDNYLNEISISIIDSTFSTPSRLDTSLGTQARGGSQLAIAAVDASVGNSAQWNLFFFYPNGSIATINWKTVWHPCTIVYSSASFISQSLAAVARNGSQSMQVYFMHDYFPSEIVYSDGRWQLAASSNKWVKADYSQSVIVAVAWPNNVRLYYGAGGALNEQSFNGQWLDPKSMKIWG